MIFGLAGQLAWMVENMYFSAFIQANITKDAWATSVAVASSAVVAALATIFGGALSDRLGKRKLFVCFGYIIWGIVTAMFALFGNTNRDNDEAYQLVKINTHTGVVNNKCLDIVQNFLFYVGNDTNLYKMSHVTTSTNTLITTKLNTNVDLKKPPLNKSIYDIRNAHTYYDKYITY